MNLIKIFHVQSFFLLLFLKQYNKSIIIVETRFSLNT